MEVTQSIVFDHAKANFDNKDTSNVIIKLVDGKKLYASTAFLIASPTLKPMVTGDRFSENKEKTIDFSMIPGMKDAIYFVYHSALPDEFLTGTDLVSCAKALNYLQIDVKRVNWEKAAVRGWSRDDVKELASNLWILDDIGIVDRLFELCVLLTCLLLFFFFC